MSEPIRRYSEFWSYYLREHAKPQTRALHYLGTGLATAAMIGLSITGRFWLAPLVLLAGYGPAWAAHFFVEKNRPATFTYPLWSLISDYRMAWIWATGRLETELANAGVTRAPALL
jgi:hypothetical protein